MFNASLHALCWYGPNLFARVKFPELGFHNLTRAACSENRQFKRQRAKAFMGSQFGHERRKVIIGQAGWPMWYVYFLELSNGDIYVGSTPDLKRGLASHQKGHVQSTKACCPVKLRSYVAVETESKARELEKYFKSGSGKAVARKRFLERQRLCIGQTLLLAGGRIRSLEPNFRWVSQVYCLAKVGLLRPQLL